MSINVWLKSGHTFEYAEILASTYQVFNEIGVVKLKKASEPQSQTENKKKTVRLEQMPHPEPFFGRCS